MYKLTALGLALLLAMQAPAGFAQPAPATTAAPTPAPAPAPASLAARIDAALAPSYPPGQPGATVIVVKDGQVILRKGYGEADAVKHIPMTPETVLRLGSITKQFTAASIMMLVDSGKLALSDDITRFFPDYPTHGKKITVEHLLTHTSGIVSYTGRKGFMETVNRDFSTTQMIGRFKNDPLEFEPGTRFAYNNSGYFLLGAIIEKVSGMPYAKFVEQRIFIPLGMRSTAYEGHDRSALVHAAGHARAPQGFTYSAPLSMTQPYAAGALVSTVDDLARWDAAIAAGKLLAPASWKKMATPYTLADGKSTGYGYGLGTEQLDGVPILAHGGGINGFATYAMRLPEHKLYVAVLTNTESGMTPPEQIAHRAARLAIGRELPTIQTVAVDPALFDTYVGRYELRPDLVVTISRAGTRFMAEASGQGSAEMKVLAPNRFLVEEVGAELTFDKDASGEMGLVLQQGGARIPARRLK